MYIEYAAVNHFRCLEDFEILLEPGVNLVVGSNGTGKTSVMEALATGLAGLIYHLYSPNACNILDRDISVNYVPETKTSFRREYKLPVSIETSMVIGDKTYTWRRSRGSEKANAATGMKMIANPTWEMQDGDDEYESETPLLFNGEKNSIRDWTRAMEADPDAIYPLVAYRRARGFLVPEKRTANFTEGRLDRKKGYQEALKGKIADVYSWLLYMESAEEEPKEYRIFKEAIQRAMQRLNGNDKEVSVAFDKESMSLICSDGEKALSIDKQSSAYYWLIWLLVDLIVRSLILNPHLDSLEQMEGVVLLDEIDLHLHPRWQWNILDTLRMIFPKVQFIISTHAPIVISSCKDVHMIRLSEQHQVDYPGTPYAFSVNDVIEFTQGSFGVLPELKELSSQFERAYNSQDYEQARAVSGLLQERFPDSTEAKRADIKLSFVR